MTIVSYDTFLGVSACVLLWVGVFMNNVFLTVAGIVCVSTLILSAASRHRFGGA